MNVRSLSVLALLFLAVTACRFFSPQPEPLSSTPTTAATGEEVTVVPIGLVQRQTDIVEHGPGGVEFLGRLAEQADLFANDAIRVSGGGEALLDFGDALRLVLFNDSQMGVNIEPAPDTPPIVQFYLFYGGFLGNKVAGEGDTVQVITPAGAEITVTGTQFFVTYDPNSGETVAGNFDGSVQLDVASGSMSLSRSHYIIINSAAQPGVERPFFQTPEDFASAARSMRSIHAAVNALDATPTPTSTGQPSATPTSGVPRAVYLLQANCRQGPDLAWQPLVVIEAGAEVPVTGRTRDSSWYQVQYNRISCWSSASVLQVENGQLAPIIDVPPPPTPTWTPTPTPTETPTPTITPTATEPVSPPPAPINLDTSAICAPPWEVELYWTDVADNEDGYTVYRAPWNNVEDEWGDLELLTNSLPPDSRYFLDSQGYSGRTIYWIGAANTAGTGWESIVKEVCVE